MIIPGQVPGCWRQNHEIHEQDETSHQGRSPRRSRLATRRAGSDACTPPDPLRIAAGEAPHVAIHEQGGGLAAARLQPFPAHVVPIVACRAIEGRGKLPGLRLEQVRDEGIGAGGGARRGGIQIHESHAAIE